MLTLRQGRCFGPGAGQSEGRRGQPSQSHPQARSSPPLVPRGLLGFVVQQARGVRGAAGGRDYTSQGTPGRGRVVPPCRGEEEDGDSGRMESGEGWRRRCGERGERGGGGERTGRWLACLRAAPRAEAGGRWSVLSAVRRLPGGERRGPAASAGAGAAGGGSRPGLGAARGRCRRWQPPARRAAPCRASAAAAGAGLRRGQTGDAGGSSPGGPSCAVGAARGRRGGDAGPSCWTPGARVSREGPQEETVCPVSATRGELSGGEDRAQREVLLLPAAAQGRSLPCFSATARAGVRGGGVFSAGYCGPCPLESNCSSVSLLIAIMRILTFGVFFHLPGAYSFFILEE